MKIDKIRLINWRSHEDTVLEFSTGTNVFVGIMGSGKSSVFDAITYGLFGRFPKSDRREVKLEDIVRFGQKEGEVHIWFSDNDNKYMVIRGVNKDEAVLYNITNAKQIIQKDKKRVTTSIISLLGADYSLFTRAIYSEQNNMDYFLSLPPGKRKEELDKLLGIDRFYSALSNTNTVIRRFENRVADVDIEKTEIELKQLDKQIVTIKAQINDMNDRYVQFNDKLIKHEKNSGLKKSLFESAKVKKQKFDELMARKSNLSGKLDNLTEQSENIQFDQRVYESLKFNLIETEKGIAQNFNVYTLSIKKQKDMYAEISKLSERINACDEAVKEVDRLKQEISGMGDVLSKLKELVSNSEDVKNKLSVAKQKVKELSDVKELDVGTTKCPVCGSQVDDEHILKFREERNLELKKYSQSIDELGLKLNDCQGAIQQSELKKSLLEKKKNNLESLEKLIDDGRGLNDKLVKLKTEYDALTSVTDNLHTKIEQLRKDKQEMSLHVKDMEFGLGIITNLDKVKLELKKIDGQLNDMEFDNDKYMQIYDAYKSSLSELEKIELEMKSLTELKYEKENLYNAYIKERDVLLELLSKVKVYQLKILELRKFKNAMNDTVVELRNYITNALNVAIEELWPYIYPYKDYDGIVIEATEKDYNLMIHVQGNWVEIGKVVSGGERMCAALVLRIALAIVLTPELSWLVLDEPTHNLDNQAVELMSQMLEQKIPEVVNQTFVITHDQSLLDHEFNRVY